MKPVPVSQGSPRGKPQTSPPRLQKKIWALLIGVGVLLLLAGSWTFSAVQETVNDHLTAGLQTILQANIEALQVVVEKERRYVQAWARDAEVRTLTHLLHVGQNPEQTRRELFDVLANAIAADGYLGYAIIGPEGTILATDKPDLFLGKSLSPAAMELLSPILGKESSFEKPIDTNALLNNYSEPKAHPVLLVKAPIADKQGKIIAALVFTIDPKKDFTRILSVAELGRTGSTFAFDNQGVMLSESRHESQLKQLGLLPDLPGATTILSLQLRDPGIDLTRGNKSQQPASSQPLTRMAQAAVSGTPGIDVAGYRDYRGVEVVGAWQWLHDYGFGVATEIERSEALRSLRPVRLAFIGLFSLLVLSAGGFLIFGYFLNQQQEQLDELRELGQYTLVEKIGEGGMGKVYKARHALLRRPTAIKLIREDQLDETALKRFEQEVQLTSQLTHPHTISIYDYGHSPDGVFYYAMEYLSGITLDQLIKIESRIPADRVIYILQQICGSLAEAHAQGLIHRDIKPGNIMLCSRGGEYDFVKVLDFGLVRKILPSSHQETMAEIGIMGTPGFIAPELLVIDPQVEVDARSDLYAVGALGFLLLTGQLIFSDNNVDNMLHEIVNSDPPRPSEVVDVPIPEALDKLIHCCLSRHLEQRPVSASELAEKLSTITLEGSWTQQQARDWWQDKSSQVAAERKLERAEGSEVSITVLGVDFVERS